LEISEGAVSLHRKISREFFFHNFSVFNPKMGKVEWFTFLLNARFRYASAYSAAILLPVFYVNVLLCQFSLLHPFASILNAFCESIICNEFNELMLFRCSVHASFLGRWNNCSDFGIFAHTVLHLYVLSS
jgi:hypothetical protein